MENIKKSERDEFISEFEAEEITLEKITNLVKNLKNEKLTLLADIDNLSKKHLKELKEVEEYALMKFLREFIPQVDMLGSILDNKNVSEEVKNWLRGFEMIHQNIEKLLLEYKIKRIKTNIGDEFNSEHHFAISDDFSNEIKEGKVMKIVQNGYLLKDRLLKPVVVILSKGKLEGERK